MIQLGPQFPDDLIGRQLALAERLENDDVEKTGIGLKDFYGAFTVFLACLLFEYHQKK